MELLAPGLRVVFCGINPGLSSAHQGYPFANGSNRFWKVIHQAGFTESQLAPEQWQQLKDNGCGITALVARRRWRPASCRATSCAAVARCCKRKSCAISRALAILGKQAFATAFGVKNAPWGKQALTLGKPRCGYCLTPAD